MSVFFGIIILCVLGWWIARHFYNKGLTKSGHVCVTTGPIAAQPHQMVEFKAATLPCLRCGELVPFQVTFKRSFGEEQNGKPYTPQISYEDWELHMLAHHKNATDKSK